jgi:hypothetical protein
VVHGQDEHYTAGEGREKKEGMQEVISGKGFVRRWS